MTQRLRIFMVDGNVVETNGDVETMAKISELMESGKGTLAYKTGTGEGGFISPQHVVRVALFDESAPQTATDTLTVMKAMSKAAKKRGM